LSEWILNPQKTDYRLISVTIEEQSAGMECNGCKYWRKKTLPFDIFGIVSMMK